MEGTSWENIRKLIHISAYEVGKSQGYIFQKISPPREVRPICKNDGSMQWKRLKKLVYPSKSFTLKSVKVEKGVKRMFHTLQLL